MEWDGQNKQEIILKLTQPAKKKKTTNESDRKRRGAMYENRIYLGSSKHENLLQLN